MLAMGVRGLLLALCLVSPAHAALPLQGGEVEKAASGLEAQGQEVRAVGAWDHPYTDITDVQDLSAPLRLHGQYSVERLGRKSLLSGDFNGDGLKDLVTRGSRGRTYVLFGQRNYKYRSSSFFRVDAGTFAEVRNKCKAAGGDLASIHSEREMAMAAEVCSGNCYIGLVRNKQGDPFYWIDGEPTTFFAWDGGQPGHPNPNKNETKVVKTKSGGDGWHDWLQGESRFPGICKKVTESDMPSELDPTFFDGFNGFIVKGVHPSSIAAGDINGDGIDDLLLGDQGRRALMPPPSTCNCYHKCGALHVILGTRSGFPKEIHVNWLQGWNGFRVEGFVSFGRFGHSLSSGGDVNGDGIQDMVVGTYDIDSTEIGLEEVFILYGKAFSQSPVYNLDNWAATGNPSRTGSASGSIFRARFPLYEIFLSAAIASPPVGDQYIRGFMIKGVPPSTWHWLGRDRTGYSLSSSGDINNDGVADIVIGSYGATPGDSSKVMAGAVYVILGRPSTTATPFPVQMLLETLAYPYGFKLIGDKRWDLLGQNVDTSGDVNGDGIKDIVVGSPGVDVQYLNSNNKFRWRHNVGKVYVVLGDAALGTSKGADWDMGTLALPDGFAITGAERGTRCGTTFSARDDLNNDGITDIVIGMPRSAFDFKHSMRGGVHIYYGRSSYTAFTNSIIGVENLIGNNGLTISGFDIFDMAGSSVSTGDFTGDGKAELVIGVPSHALIARVWEKTGTALMLDVSTTVQTVHTTPTPVEVNTTLLDFCQCPSNANATSFTVCMTMEVEEITDTLFEQHAQVTKQAFVNLLLTGNASIADPVKQSQVVFDMAHQTSDGADSMLNIHFSILFSDYVSASEAIAQYTGHGDFEIAVRDETELNLAVVGSPGLQPCQDAASAPPIQVGASGFAITGIEFDWRCMTAGCWVIDLIYTRGHEASVNAFYLPKTDPENPTWDVIALQEELSAPAPLKVTYPQEVQDTFLPRNFPCGSDDYDPSNPTWKYTGCCIKKFLAKYRPVNEFQSVFLSQNYDSLCNTTNLRAGPFSADVFTTPVPAAQGLFQGVDLSRFEDTKMRAPGIYGAQIKLDEDELLRKAGMIDPTSSILRRKVQSFIGMAQFVPTDYQFLDSSASQINLFLEKGDFFTVGTSGEVQATFVDYMYMRLHELKEGTNWLQYVALTFTLSADWDVNTETGVVPLSSVRIGKGETAETAVWSHACASNDNTAIWNDATFQAEFDAALQKDCAPAPRFCQNQAAIGDSFVAFHIPVGKDYFSTETDYEAANKIFVEYVVSVVNKVTNLQSSTVMTAEMPIMPGGTSLWCESFEAAAELKEIATVDMTVGSAGTLAEMSRLNKISNIDSAALSEGVELASYSAASIQSGLITLAVKGDPTIFDRPGFASYSIEMEHLLTVHVMETGSITSSSVQNLIESGGAFTVKADEIAQTGYLEPTAAMLELCTFNPLTPTLSNPIPSPCIMRRDVEFSKCPVSVGAPCQALELDPTDTTSASVFMKTLLGDNDFAHTLGANFSKLMTAEHSLNSRYNRAWWVNPGHVWNPILGENRFQLSQHVMVAALVRLKGAYTPGAAGNRRLLLQSLRQDSAPQDYKRGSIGGNIRYTQGDNEQLRSVELIAEVLGVPKTVISTWEHQVKLTGNQACKSQEELKQEMGTQINELWMQANPSIQRVYINSVVKSLNGVACAGNEARRSWSLRAETGGDFSAATASVEVAIVLSSESDGLTICSIAAAESILSIKKLYSDPSLSVDTATSDGCGGGGAEESDQFSLFGLNFGITIALIAVLGVVGCCMCIALVFFCGRALADGEKKGRVHPGMSPVIYMVRRFSTADPRGYGSGPRGRYGFGGFGGHGQDRVDIRIPTPERVYHDDAVPEQLLDGGKGVRVQHTGRNAW